jgi:hypothetical protein
MGEQTAEEKFSALLKNVPVAADRQIVYRK